MDKLAGPLGVGPANTLLNQHCYAAPCSQILNTTIQIDFTASKNSNQIKRYEQQIKNSIKQK